jgi:hypothetical protein
MEVFVGDVCSPRSAELACADKDTVIIASPQSSPLGILFNGRDLLDDCGDTKEDHDCQLPLLRGLDSIPIDDAWATLDESVRGGLTFT